MIKKVNYINLLLTSLVFTFGLFLQPIKVRAASNPGGVSGGGCDPSCYNMSGLPDTICGASQCKYCSWCIGDSSQSDYQTSLKSCCDTQTTSLSCFTGNTLEVCSKEEGGTLGFTGVVVNSFLTMISGSQIKDSSTGLTYNNGAVGGVSSLISYLYLTPPVSSVDYIADLGNNLGIIKPAYAQGTGFNGLKPILGIWKSFRDIAYVFFVLVFLSIGFMIMFRVKINPRTVITIQNSIPKIVITMILVTFSYAIAGLVIDLMYLFSAIGVSIISPTDSMFAYISGVIATLMNTPAIQAACIPLAGVCGRINALGQNLDPSNPSIFYFLMSYIGQGNDYATTVSHLLSPPLLIGEMVGAPKEVLDALSNVPFLGTGPVRSLISLILSAILLFALIKTLFTLVKAYVMIIIGVIIGPLQIMLNAFPMQEKSAFGSWLRNLISNVAVFPAIIIYMALMSRILTEVETGELWTPPMLGIVGYDTPARIMVAIIGYGMLLMLPKMLQIVQDTMKVPAFKYGSAIGEAMKPVTGPIGGTWNWTKATVKKGTTDIGGDAIAGALALGRASRQTPTGSTTIPVPTGHAGNAQAEE